MKKLLIVCILLSSYHFPTQAQSNPESQLGAWYMYGGSHELAASWKLKSLAHFRMFEVADELQQYLFRIGANYKINKHLSLTGGYAYLNTDASYRQHGGTEDEHRLYEDVLINHAIAKLKLAHRIRLEHRFFERDTQHWIRYELGFSYPLNKRWGTYLFDEIFFNFQGETFAQNWLGGGFTYKLSSTTKFKLGFMNIATNTASFNRLQIGVAFSTQRKSKRPQ